MTKTNSPTLGPEVARLLEQNFVGLPAIAEAFLREHGSALAYNPTIKWLRFNGRIFEPVRENDLFPDIQSVILQFADQLSRQGRWADASRAAALAKTSVYREILRLTEAVCETDIRYFQRHVGYVNTPAGLYDVRTGQLNSTTPDFFLLASTRLPINQTGKCDRIMRVLKTLFDDDIEKVEFFRRYLGSVLAGFRAKKLIVLKAADMDGIRLLFQLIVQIAGSYCVEIPVTAAIEPNRNRPLQQLLGLRLAVDIHLAKYAMLDERILWPFYERPEIQLNLSKTETVDILAPPYTIIMTTPADHGTPVFHGSRDEIPKLFHVIPAEGMLATEDYEFLRHQALFEEGPAFLHWLLEPLRTDTAGFIDQRSDPAAALSWIADETEAYADAQESATIDAFLRDEVTVDPEVQPGFPTASTAREFYSRYRTYCTERGGKPMTETAFGKKMSERFEKIRTRKGLVYSGVRLNRHARG